MKPLCPYVFLLVLLSNATFVYGQTFNSSNLPIIVINTGGNTIPDEPKLTADMGVIDNGPGVRNNVADTYNNYNGKVGIEIRGSSSQMFPKKQYAIELRQLNGADTAVALLGLPAESDWVLFAPYNDKSLMRDVLAYKLGRDMGRYAPRTRYCELILNGQYQGIYVLIEKIKRDKNRVDISRLEPHEVSGTDVTGGYIIKIDKSSGNSGEGWNSAFAPKGRSQNQVITFQYEYPAYDEIVSAQKTYIRNYVSAFEETLAGPDFKNSESGYAKYIDVNSFVDFLILNEFSKNVDGYRLSTFFHKQKSSDGGKLLMGPVWDFNLGFGNADYCTTGSTTGYVTDFNKICPNDIWLIPFWWDRLMEDAVFRGKVGERWRTLRETKFKTSTIHQFIDSVATVLNAESQQRNFQRWPVLGTYVWPNYYVGPTFQSEVDWLKKWINDRANWLDQKFTWIITDTDKQGQRIKMSAHPNPFLGETQLQYQLNTPATIQIVIYDLMGRQVEANKKVHEESGVFETTLGKELPSGSYFYSILENGISSGMGRLIKQ